MRVVLTNLLVTGRPTSSPVRTRLATLSLQPNPAEDHAELGIGKLGPFAHRATLILHRHNRRSRPHAGRSLGGGNQYGS
jgi:hypothetical protein